MIRHCVFLNLRASQDAGTLEEILGELRNLCENLPETGPFLSGPNRDFEAKSQDFPAGFTIDFASEEALQTYADHPEHKALGARLVAICQGGADGIMVFDLEGDA